MATRNNYSNWGKLPSSVICNVLHYAQQSSKLTLQNNTPLFTACQLVCKAWSQAAQESLYQQVHLGPNTLRFLNTISNAKELGNLVKVLIIEQGVADVGKTLDILESIITRCPNIEELYSFEPAVRDDVWTYLLSAKKVPLHLKVFTTATSDATSLSLYPPLALRFEKTLTRLQINLSTALSSNDAKQGGSHCLLSERLNHFISLQQLCVDRWQFKSWQELDSLLDRCPPTLRELVLIHLDLSNDTLFPQEYEINRNTHVKQLKIGASDIPTAALQYFKSKMTALEKLELLFITFPNGSLQDASIWWAYLMEICMNLASYNINFAHSNYQDIYQLRNCMKFSLGTTAKWKDIKNKTMRLSFNSSLEKDNVISLSKAWHSYAIDLEYDKVDYLELISQ